MTYVVQGFHLNERLRLPAACLICNLSGSEIVTGCRGNPRVYGNYLCGIFLFRIGGGLVGGFRGGGGFLLGFLVVGVV